MKLVFIFGSAIADKENITTERWISLVTVADARRLNVEDVKKVLWGALRQTLRWWWKRYQKNAKGECPKLWNSISVDATSYWQIKS